ncbi:DUF3197 domain-containing protein [Oceanithermus sp.]|jgi:hypothetical protein
MEIIGFKGMPEKTLEALESRLKKLHFPSMTVVMVTDSQGDRQKARYRVLLVAGKHVFFTEEAFGPGFGEEGAEALARLVRRLRDAGVRRFKEATLPPDVYEALDEMPPDKALQRVLASAALADPRLYAA